MSDQPQLSEPEEPARRRMSPQNIETFVDQTIRQAQRRGDFDNLPGAGKPLRHLETEQDPDWWLKGFLERERVDLSAALPGPMALRRERAAFPESLLDARDEARARERLEDFNDRVIADRKKPHTGPGSPAVVGRVDVEAMVVRWRELRAERASTPASNPEPGPGTEPMPPPRRWWQRRRRPR